MAATQTETWATLVRKPMGELRLLILSVHWPLARRETLVLSKEGFLCDEDVEDVLCLKFTKPVLPNNPAWDKVFEWLPAAHHVLGLKEFEAKLDWATSSFPEEPLRKLPVEEPLRRRLLARAKDAPFYEALDTWLEDLLLRAGVPLSKAEGMTYDMIKDMERAYAP